MEEMQKIAEKQARKSREFQEKAAEQMVKLAEYDSLRDAWMRALSNVN